MLHYWYKTCPFCQGQGILIICMDEDTTRLFLSCDECLLAWWDATWIGQQHGVFNTYDRQHHVASMTEIKHHGWEKYAVHTYQKKLMTQAEYALWKQQARGKHE